MWNRKGMTLIEIMLAMTTLTIVSVMFLHGIMAAARIQARSAMNEKNLIRFDILESALYRGVDKEIEGVKYSKEEGREVLFFVDGETFHATGDFIKITGNEEETESFQIIQFVHDSIVP